MHNFTFLACVLLNGVPLFIHWCTIDMGDLRHVFTVPVLVANQNCAQCSTFNFQISKPLGIAMMTDRSQNGIEETKEEVISDFVLAIMLIEAKTGLKKPKKKSFHTLFLPSYCAKVPLNHLYAIQISPVPSVTI
jgi:hypothetical protein